MGLTRYLTVLLAGLALEAVIWHLLSVQLGFTGLIAAAGGLAAAFAAVALSGFRRRARYLLAIALTLAALLSLVLMAAMPALQPVAALACAALAAFGFGAIGFALYLREG